jgi:predicted transcriptional regulator
MTRKDYIIRYPGKPLNAPTLRDAIIKGKPVMPKENICFKCGKRFDSKVSRSRRWCVECLEKKDKKEKQVVCMECGERFKSITATHVKKHNMTLSEYKRKHRGARTKSRKHKERSEKLRTESSIFEKRKKQLESMGIEIKTDGDILIYGNYREKTISRWDIDEDDIVSHFWESRKKGRIPIIVSKRDWRAFNSLSGFDPMVLGELLFKLKYLPIIKGRLE